MANDRKGKNKHKKSETTNAKAVFINNSKEVRTVVLIWNALFVVVPYDE